MFTQLTQWLQEYIASHRESSLSILRKTDLYRADGSINETQVKATAQYYATTLRDFFSAEMLQELQGHLQECSAAQDWIAAAVWLCMHLDIALLRAPLHFLHLTADEQLFQRFIEELVDFIA